MTEKSDLGATERISQMSRSGIREIMDLAWSMENVNHLEVGEPDFPTPKWISDAHNILLGPNESSILAAIGFMSRNGNFSCENPYSPENFTFMFLNSASDSTVLTDCGGNLTSI